MKSMLRLLAVGAFALITVPGAFAQIPEVSTLPVIEPLDVGGTILQPGDYTIRILPSQTTRNLVQITSPDLKTIYTTVLAVPHQMQANEEMPNTMFVYYPAGEGQPAALRTWYAPDPVSKGGHDIVYEESRAKQLARLAKSSVVSYTGEAAVADLGATELHVVTPEATVEPYAVTEVQTPVVTEEKPVQIAESRPMELPQTAGSVPLIALLGLSAVGAAVAFRATR
jgi:hypothetical protein